MPMKMRANATLSKLRQEQPAVGTWLQLNSINAARLLAAQRLFDWMLLDLEHVPYDYPTAATILSCISDISAGRITPLARVPAGTIDHIKTALDCGAQGVVVPMINTADEAAAAVRWARFPPAGDRGAGGLAPHLGFGVSRPHYIANANREILVGIQIETRQAVDNIEQILDVAGIDLIFVGPNDLHLSLGLPPMFWSNDPAFAGAIGKVIQGCRKRSIPYGTLCRDALQVKDRQKDGFTFLGLGSDAHFMLTFAGQQYGTLHNEREPEETWCNLVKLPSGG
jgi:4-hydroxy-2-oxoheptanedioate aldolase